MSSREIRERGPKKSKRARVHFSDVQDNADGEEAEAEAAAPGIGHNNPPPEVPVRQPRPHFSDVHDQQVLLLREWAALNNISIKTARRILKAPGAPVVTMLTKKLIGITIAADRAWKATRVRTSA